MHMFLLSVSFKKNKKNRTIIKRPKMGSGIKNVFGRKELIGIVIPICHGFLCHATNFIYCEAFLFHF